MSTRPVFWILKIAKQSVHLSCHQNRRWDIMSSYQNIHGSAVNLICLLIDVGANRSGNMLGGLMIMGLLLLPGPTGSYISLMIIVTAYSAPTSRSQR
jgi:hypothetical protein